MSLEVGQLRALAHPVRLQILSLLTGAELSAADIARELGISQANASYHLRQLAAVGEVVEARRERVRGGVAKLYRHPWEQPPSLLLDPKSRELFVRALAQELVRRFGQRGTHGRHQAFTDAELWVDPEEWRAVVDEVASASKRLHAAARPPRTPGTARVSMTAALFPMSGGAAGEATADQR